MQTTESIENRVVETYRKRAARYDVSANLYYVVGFREFAYRKRAVRALGLKPGDTVIEIGCGTGLNFPLLQRAVGPSGKIIGVDLTDAMLAEAGQRVEKASWSNVDLVNCDAAEYEFPGEIDGIISTFALSLSPRCGEVVRNGSRALSPGGRWVVMDLKLPPSPLSKLFPLAWPFLRPFSVTEDVIKKCPWADIYKAMYRNLENTSIDEWYSGIVYLASGERAVSGEGVAQT